MRPRYLRLRGTDNYTAFIRIYLLCTTLLLCYLRVPTAISFAQDGVTSHIVKPGENLSMIAAKYGVSVSALIRSNGIGNPNYLVVGQVLMIPIAAAPSPPEPASETPTPQVDIVTPDEESGTNTPPASYIPERKVAPATNGAIHTVYSGETLSTLAARYGTTVAAIAARNGLLSYVIYAGQRLIIPSVVVRSTARSTEIASATAPPRATPPIPTATPTRLLPRLFLLPPATATPLLLPE